MRVLITGGGGQLAGCLMASRPGDVDAVSPAREDLDISDPQAVAAALRQVQPAVIINAAAWTDVDGAETHPHEAHLANATGPRLLALAAAGAGIRLIHLSTDFVFDGRASRAYLPEDPPNPLSEYGRSKLEGEIHVREILGDRALIIRSAWLYSAQGRNFLTTMLGLMRDKGSVRVVADQTGTPTAAASLAAALWRAVATPDFLGTRHFTDAGVATRHELALAIAEEALALGLLKSPATVVPIRTRDYPTAARRPAYSALDSSGTWAALGLKVRPWRAVLRDELRQVHRA